MFDGFVALWWQNDVQNADAYNTSNECKLCNRLQMEIEEPNAKQYNMLLRRVSACPKWAFK